MTDKRFGATTHTNNSRSENEAIVRARNGSKNGVRGNNHSLTTDRELSVLYNSSLRACLLSNCLVDPRDLLRAISQLKSSRCQWSSKPTTKVKGSPPTNPAGAQSPYNPVASYRSCITKVSNNETDSCIMKWASLP